jgi:hypothetical protein
MDVRLAVARRAVLRISVSNWSTDADDVAASVASVRRAAARGDSCARQVATR